MGPRKPPKPKKVTGLQTLLLAIMMAGSADSFKKRQLPLLKPQDKDERPSAKTLTTWFRSAKATITAEGVAWLYKAADGIRLDNATQKFYLELDDDDGIDAESTVPLEGIVIDIDDEDVLSTIIPILHAYGAPAPEYYKLKKGEDYTKAMILTDWNAIRKEIDAFNAQMMIALADCGMPEIYDRVDRGYHNDYHPLGGLLAWRLLVASKSEDNDDAVADWNVKLSNIVHNGAAMCTTPNQLRNWIRAIDHPAEKLAGLNQTDETIAALTVHVVLSYIQNKQGTAWEPWRACVRDIKKDIRNESLQMTWRVVSAKLQREYIHQFGEESLDALTSAMTKQNNTNTRTSTATMPAGVALAATTGSGKLVPTTYEEFLQAGSMAIGNRATGKQSANKKNGATVQPNQSPSPSKNRPVMPKWTCAKCGQANIHHYLYGPQHPQSHIVRNKCPTCNTKRDIPNSANEQAAVAVPLTHDMAQSASATDNADHGFWASHRGEGNDFGLGAIMQAPNSTIPAMLTSNNEIPTLCSGCARPVIDDHTGNAQCDLCAANNRRSGPARSTHFAQTMTNALTAGAVIYTASHLAITTARHARMPTPATPHGVRHVGFALFIAVLAVTAGYARGAEVINYGSYNSLNSTSIHSVPLYGLDQGSSDVNNCALQLAMLSKDGMTADHFFIDSGCSTTIINDRTVLHNIRTIPGGANVHGIIGCLNIQFKADLRLPIRNQQGRITTLVVPDVYYHPDSQYNLLSCSQLEDSGYDVQFRNRTIVGHGQQLQLIDFS